MGLPFVLARRSTNLKAWHAARREGEGSCRAAVAAKASARQEPRPPGMRDLCPTCQSLQGQWINRTPRKCNRRRSARNDIGPFGQFELPGQRGFRHGSQVQPVCRSLSIASKSKSIFPARASSRERSSPPGRMSGSSSRMMISTRLPINCARWSEWYGVRFDLKMEPVRISLRCSSEMRELPVRHSSRWNRGPNFNRRKTFHLLAVLGFSAFAAATVCIACGFAYLSPRGIILHTRRVVVGTVATSTSSASCS